MTDEDRELHDKLIKMPLHYEMPVNNECKVMRVIDGWIYTFESAQYREGPSSGVIESYVKNSVFVKLSERRAIQCL